MKKVRPAVNPPKPILKFEDLLVIKLGERKSIFWFKIIKIINKKIMIIQN